MAEVEWTDEAVRNLGLIVDYISIFDPAAALRMAQHLIDASNSLRDFPHRGRLTPDGYREVPTVRPYVILYDVSDDRVSILDSRHGARAPRLA